MRERRKLSELSSTCVMGACLAMLAPSIATAATPKSVTEYETIDTNDDGRVSSSEYEVYTRKLFDEIDSNGDDKLTSAEITASKGKFNRYVFTADSPARPVELTTAQRIQLLDVNRDDTISQGEHANAAAAKFQQMDGNHNGELTQLEFDSGG